MEYYIALTRGEANGPMWAGTNNHYAVRTIVRDKGHFCSTDNFRIQPEAVSYAANHSTYLRLDRAEKILQDTPSFDGIMAFYKIAEISALRLVSSPGPLEIPP